MKFLLQEDLGVGSTASSGKLIQEGRSYRFRHFPYMTISHHISHTAH